mgnify:FL=1
MNYLKWQQNGSDTNKKYDVFVRYNTSLSDDQLKGECYRLFQAILGNIITGNPKFTGPRIEFITCMLMCALHIDWKPAVKKFGTDKATIKQNFGNDKRILNNLHMEFILWGMEMKKKANGGANTANIAESLQHNMNENKDVDLVWSIFVGDDDDEDWFNDNSTQKPGSNTFSQSNIMNRENTAEALEEAKKFNNTFYNLFEKINR